MKRTNVVLDEKKVEAVKKAFGKTTTREAIDFALEEILRMYRRRSILKLKGKLELDLDLDDIRKTS